MNLDWWQRALVLSGMLMLAACTDRPAQTWSLATGGLYAGAIGPSGQHVAVGSIFHGGSLWQMPDYERLFDWNLDADRQLGDYSAFTAIAISDDGQRVATVQGRQVVIWSATEGNALTYFEAPAMIRSVALDQTGSRFVLGLEEGTVAVFNAASGEVVQRLVGHRGGVHSVALSGDGRRVLSGGDDRRAIYWSADDGLILQHRRHDNQVRTVALSASGVYAFSAAQGDDGKVWNTATGNVVRVIPGRQRVLSTARFVHNDNELLVGDRRHGVSRWHLQAMERRGHWRLGSQGLYARESHVILDLRPYQGGVLALSSNGKLALLQ
ncbi:hypothetical protein E4656_16760 [Natronospirillum operosum]|uniref:Uncharacterized protein n=1 Tax=Natronospirillum operosum TaxID=2759953 RepID=A0A4Z0W344_9GAMM|nr:hypothetical protein [Natronospirillum operosum]TGG91369.1 hypothetical protein E4656_16760 [Natronospirillum operosum]